MFMKNRGFTLIELMVTLAIMVVMLSWAVPSFRTIIQNNRITTQANEFLSAISIARSEAIKRGVSVSLCSSTDQATCSGAATWENGWIVFSDGTGVPGALDGTDTILRVGQAYEGASTLAAAGGAPTLSFDPAGRALAASTFTLSTPDCKGNEIRTITIALTGRAAVTRTACP